MLAHAVCAATLLAIPLVAVDAGHGGPQEGAPGICGIAEKEVTLALARRTAAHIDASHMARALLVRKSDVPMGLQQRATLANAHGASLFVSIHANASADPHVHGVETFFLSHRSDSRRVQNLARRENDGLEVAPPPPPDALQHILQGLSLDAAHTESQQLAMRLQHTLQAQLHSRGRGVLQAPFVVLQGAQMAAALVEVGFVTHPMECRRLAAPGYQEQVARALASGILAHLQAQRATEVAAHHRHAPP
jgi:N-acetylmuramoyl-L-alanine amidase